jgi:hypothetical protein
MSKLYWVKTYKKRGEAVGLATKGHCTGKSQQEVIDLISKEGIRRVITIRHFDKNDDNTHRNTRQIGGNEMLQIWKGVAAKK